MPFEENGIQQYTLDELKGILKQKSATVIDVRTAEEYESGHIPGVPLHPMQEVADWVSSYSPTGTYVMVCRSGGRSQKVAEYLKANGFSDVSNFSGGMLGWDGDVKTGMEP